ncbi:hypothetical protein Dred_2763 [Desulforamulus reducens MI-1]|uniref:Uncharacterized protein n=1 Tax=Desulforamulus reducens (strain ATCC BAA-1160 / DSM 100696 / MI-1) TaxID=349161 RepID=A4J864_DESRM|nr:hypothetical protein Dred_2763 [Desulforamulus reducens MI-1]
MELLVLVKGAGDLATGVAHRLFRCGMQVVITEIAQPVLFVLGYVGGQPVLEAILYHRNQWGTYC